jgi:DNA repair ATPase RecN
MSVLVFLTACGGDGGGPRLTKEEFASKADAICGKYNQQVKALDNPTSLKELADVADQTIPILHNAIRDLDKLNPPESEQDTVDQWLDQVEKLEGDLEEIRDKANDGDMQGVQDVVPKADEHNKRSNELATELGMTVCNKD